MAVEMPSHDPGVETSADPARRSRVAIVITHTFAARNYVQSGLAEGLEEALSARVEFVSEMALQELHSDGRRVFAHHQVAMPGTGETPAIPRWLRTMSALRRRLYALEVADSGVVHAKMRAQLQGRSRVRRAVLAAAIQVVRLLLPRSGSVRNVIRRLIERGAAWAVPASPLLSSGDWSLVVVSSPGHLPLDALLGWQARKAGIPTLCIMSSWDNMITKGPLMARVDRIAVWNGEMQEQARVLHGYPRERTPAVGALQFVVYGTARDPDEERDTLRRMGVSPFEYVVYLGSQRAPEYEVEDAAALLEVLQRSERFGRLKMVVRHHPQVPVEAFEHLTRLGAMLDSPPRYAATGTEMMAFDRRAMRHMRTLLGNAAAVFASWGTTGLLEAAIMDRPVVQLAWMDSIARQRPDQAATMKALRRYAHLVSFNAAHAHEVSDHPGDLVQRLATLHDNATVYRQRRALMLAQLTVQPFGETVDRLVADCDLFLQNSGRSSTAS